MTRPNPRRARVGLLTLLCFTASAINLPAHSAAISTSELIQAADRSENLSRLQTVLYRADVQRQLIALGVDPGAALRRAQGLSDEELRLMANQLADLPAGGDALAVVGALFLVLLILEVVGVIDIFKKV